MGTMIEGEAVQPKNRSVTAEVVDEEIRRMEVTYDLLKYKVDGWCAWPLLRHLVANMLRQVSSNQAPQRHKWTRFERLAIASQDLPKILWPPKARFVIVASALNRRSEPKNGLYKDVYFDDLLLDIDSYFKIEHLGSKNFAAASNSALVESDTTSTPVKLLAALLTRIYNPRSVLEAARGISECLRQEGLEELTFQKIARSFGQFYWSKKLYGWLFHRIQPEYLLLIDAYDDHAVVAAAKEQGIQVVELQHGFLNRHHVGYSWSEYALPYKDQMPIPDRIFLYGEYWKQELAVNGFWGKELRVVGSLRVDEWRQREIKRDETCSLVVTTQHLDTERLIAYLSDFVEIASRRLDFRLYIKLHQGEPSKAPYEKVFGTNKRVQVILGSEPPSTFELLARAHFHLSICSTCHYESLALGTPTIIVPLTGYEAALPLYKAGHAFLARTPQELFDIVVQWKDIEAPNAVSEFYFNPDALKNMKEELGCA